MKKKINLQQLQIKSFVTNLDKSNQNNLKGGETFDCVPTVQIVTYNCTGVYNTINRPCDTYQDYCRNTTTAIDTSTL